MSSKDKIQMTISLHIMFISSLFTTVKHGTNLDVSHMMTGQGLCAPARHSGLLLSSQHMGAQNK